jgi:hypothetical protein
LAPICRNWTGRPHGCEATCTPSSIRPAAVLGHCGQPPSRLPAGWYLRPPALPEPEHHVTGLPCDFCFNVTEFDPSGSHLHRPLPARRRNRVGRGPKALGAAGLHGRRPHPDQEEWKDLLPVANVTTTSVSAGHGLVVGLPGLEPGTSSHQVSPAERRAIQRFARPCNSVNTAGRATP